MKKCDVKNVPEYALDFEFWVIRFDEQGQAWFYGAWNEAEEACRVAIEVGGTVISTK